MFPGTAANPQNLPKGEELAKQPLDRLDLKTSDGTHEKPDVPRLWLYGRGLRGGMRLWRCHCGMNVWNDLGDEPDGVRMLQGGGGTTNE